MGADSSGTDGCRQRSFCDVVGGHKNIGICGINLFVTYMYFEMLEPLANSYRTNTEAQL